MEYNQFKQLLQLKGIREKETIPQLEDFIEKFPYCQTSRLLFAKALHDQNNIHYHQHLKLAAAYAANREVLRDLVEMRTADVEFEFPLPKKEIPAESRPAADVPANNLAATEISAAHLNAPSSKEKYEEWYSEDEISGRAFEDQKEKEKLVDPHLVIKQRLNEILSGSNEHPPAKNLIAPEAKPATVAGREEKPVQISSSPDPEESVYKEEILQEKKIEDEQIHPLPEKSEDEKIIIHEAGKMVDVLDKMEVEHAMEESILDSIEKLPVIAPEKKYEAPPVNKIDPQPAAGAGKMDDPSSPRSFTSWLKTISNVNPAGFEEVHAPKKQSGAASAPAPVETFEPEESQLSDDELIEKFLLEDPKIVPSKAEFYSPANQARKSVMDHDDVVSETLAQIYLKQGNNQKARWCYEKLILLHPEKSAFFAALLKEIPEGQ